MEPILQTLEDALCLSHIGLTSLSDLVRTILFQVDEKLVDSKPSHLIVGATLVTLCIVYILSLLGKLSKPDLVGRARTLPIVRGIVNKKIEAVGQELRQDLLAIYNNEHFMTSLPPNSMSQEVLLKKVKHYQMFDTSGWQQGRISGAIYTNNSNRLNEILLSVYGSNMWSNPLHSDVFAGVRKMEAEIIRMVASMFKGDPNVIVGSVTSGGTESIIMACKAYRDYAIKVRGIKGKPEIVAPVTAHAAFEKAANILGCKIVHIPVDKRTFKVDLGSMRRAINKQTCVLVGSAPQFPHGIMDPIRDIGKLGVKNNIPVHIDACLGGFLIAFAKQAGHQLDEDFDFQLPGITSISADTHKYGYAPKGTSVILYSDKKFLHHQYSVQTDWPGGIYASPTIPGSRPGALIATCWAAMLYHGIAGYVEATKEILKTTRKIRDELNEIDGITILGQPCVSVIAFGSDRIDIFKLNSKLKELGWNLNPLQFPSAIHFCVTRMHTGRTVASSFVRDIRENVAQLLTEPKSKATGSAAIYGMAQTVPDRSIVGDICTRYLDGCLGF